MKRIIIGAVLGAIPGGIMILLTVPVPGEAELESRMKSCLEKTQNEKRIGGKE